MLTTIALTLVLSCKRPSPPIDELVVAPPPPVSSSCEGPDRVERNVYGYEVRRFANACTIARCEGADYVRRTLDGVTTQRFSFSAACVIVRCEGGDQVRRDTSGRELDRTFAAFRCMPRPHPLPQQDALKFGLSAR